MASRRARIRRSAASRSDPGEVACHRRREAGDDDGEVGSAVDVADGHAGADRPAVDVEDEELAQHAVVGGQHRFTARTAASPDRARR